MPDMIDSMSFKEVASQMKANEVDLGNYGSAKVPLELMVSASVEGGELKVRDIDRENVEALKVSIVTSTFLRAATFLVRQRLVEVGPFFRLFCCSSRPI